MVDRDVTIRLTLDDQASDKAEDALDKVTTAAKDTGGEAGKLSLHLGHSRQAMMLLGDAAGPAASRIMGIATSIGNSLLKFNALDMALTGISALIGGGVALWTAWNSAQREAAQAAYDHARRMSELNEELEKQKALLSGMSASQYDLNDAYTKMVYLQERAKQLEAQAAGVTQGTFEGALSFVARKQDLETQAQAARRAAEEAELEAEVAAAKRDAEYKRGRKGYKTPTQRTEKRAAASGGGGGGGYGAAEDEWAAMGVSFGGGDEQSLYEQDLIREESASAAFEKYHEWRLKEQDDLQEQLIKSAERGAEDRLDILEEEKRAEKELLESSASVAVDIVQSIIEGDARQLASAMKSRALQATMEAAYHGILAIAAAASGNFAEAGLEATAAAQFAAFAATYGAVGGVASAVGGGGSSPSERGIRQSGADWNTAPQKKETVLVINLGGREVGRAIYESLEDYEDKRNPGRKRKAVN